MRFYHVRDAKLAIGSHLLKRYVISRYCQVPWWEAKVTRNERTKPIYRDPATGECPLDFNVSHQADLVALAAVHGYAGGRVDVGVDVVCTSERRERDHQMARAEGWPRFVDMHADVFADSEASYLKYQVLSAVPGLRPGATPDEVLDFKLRCFYTLWCLREAYVKMTGDALLADWLKSLEFRSFVPPTPAEALGVPARAGDSGQVVTRHSIVFRGEPVADANVCIQAIGPDYMCCTAVRTAPDAADGLRLRMGAFEMVALEELVSFAESRL